MLKKIQRSLALLILVTGCVQHLEASHDSAGSITKTYNPGHYIAVGPYHDLSEIDGLESFAVKGVNKRYYWREIEPHKDQYDFNEIKEDLEYLESVKKRLVIFFTDKTFNSRSPDPVPDYMHHATATNEVGGVTTLKWHPEVIERQIKLCRQLAKQFDAHPSFEGLAYQESAPSINYERLDSIGYTPELLRDGLTELLIGSAKAFPRARIFWYMNFIPRKNEYIDEVAEKVAPYHVAMGGPDILPYRNSAKRLRGIYTRFKDKMTLFCSAQSDSYRHHKLDDNNNKKRRFHRGEVPIHEDGYVPMEEIFFYGRDEYHLHYIFWTYKTYQIDKPYPGDPKDQVFADALKVIEKYPTFNNRK